MDQVRQHTTQTEDRQLDVDLKVQCRVGDREHYRTKARENSIDYVHDSIYKAKHRRNRKAAASDGLEAAKQLRSMMRR